MIWTNGSRTICRNGLISVNRSKGIWASQMPDFGEISFVKARCVNANG